MPLYPNPASRKPPILWLPTRNATGLTCHAKEVKLSDCRTAVSVTPDMSAPRVDVENSFSDLLVKSAPTAAEP